MKREIAEKPHPDELHQPDRRGEQNPHPVATYAAVLAFSVGFWAAVGGLVWFYFVR